jgi:hypothetical protein
MRKLLAIPLFLVFCMGTGATSTPSNPSAATGHVIDTSTGWNGEAFYFDLDGPLNPACTGSPTGPIRASIAPTLAQYKENVSQAMYALSSGRQVTVYYNGCVTGNAAAVFVSMLVTNHY